MRGQLAGMLQKSSEFWIMAPPEDRQGGGRSGGCNRPAPWLGGVLLISLLFMLNVTLFFTINTGMDLYGFYTIDAVAAFAPPALLSTLLNVVIACVGYACYRCLWRRQVWLTRRRWNPFTRGLALSSAPVAVAFCPAIILTSSGGKPTQIAIAGLMAGSLCITHALRDSEMKPDAGLARYWSIGAIAAILVFLALSIGGMLVLYTTEQMPPSGNFLWKWGNTWADLGYLSSEFNQRQRDALVGFTLTGSGFMVIVLGGSMLGAILNWTRANASSAYGKRPEAPEWAATVLDQLWEMWVPAPTDTAHSAWFGGHEVVLSKKQYAFLVGNKEELLYEADLIIDKVTGSALKRTQAGWSRIHFRAGETYESRRSGPFLLLCIYARHPGKRFTNAELRSLLREDLPDRPSVNVTDFFNQLRKKRPSLPVARDGDSTYLPESLKVCLLTNQGVPSTAPHHSAAEGGSVTI